jgi:hypothetical protein
MLEDRWLAVSFFAGAFFVGSSFVAPFGGAGCAGSSSGKVVSRLKPEASSWSEEAGGEVAEEGGGAGVGFCCAHAAALKANHKPP